jgi:hypothetical protein
MNQFQYVESNGVATIVATDGTNSVTIYSNTDVVLAKQTFNEFQRVATCLSVGV